MLLLRLSQRKKNPITAAMQLACIHVTGRQQESGGRENKMTIPEVNGKRVINCG